jgi:hypothetical protein
MVLIGNDLHRTCSYVEAMDQAAMFRMGFLTLIPMPLTLKNQLQASFSFEFASFCRLPRFAQCSRLTT